MQSGRSRRQKEIVGLYGKTYHFWQVDRGCSTLWEAGIDDELYEGQQVSLPSLCVIWLTHPDRGLVPWGKVKDRDERYDVDTMKKREARKGIEATRVHEDADGCWGAARDLSNMK
jgi:Protein of unknown function (DUF1264)